MSAHLHDFQYATRRAATFVAICLAHAWLIWLLGNGLDRRRITVDSAPLQVTIIREQKPIRLPPPMPAAAKKIELPALQMTVPEIIVAVASNASLPVGEDRQGDVTTITATPVETPPAIPGTPLQNISIPNSSDYYPLAAAQSGEHGLTLLNICVNALNKVDTVEVIMSSGFKRLDAAALVVGRRSRWKAATEDGKPKLTCTKFFVNFVKQ